MTKRYLLVTVMLLAMAISAMASVLFDTIPNPDPAGMASWGFQACSISELGDHIQFASTGKLASVRVGMVSWAAVSGDYTTGSAYTDPAVVADITGWDQPITLNIYSVNYVGGIPVTGSLIATKTKTFHLPWAVGSMHPYRAVTFDFSGDNITLPSEVIYGVAYNTQSYGTSPTGLIGPYCSLNVGAYSGSILAGTDVEPTMGFVSSTWSGMYGTGTSGVFSFSDGGSDFTVGYKPSVEFNITTPITVTSIGNNGWYSSETKNASGTVLNGLNYTHGGTGTAVDDAVIAQLLKFAPEGYSPSPAGLPLNMTGSTNGALQLYATNDNRGKANLTRYNANGFGSTSDLLGSSFYAKYRAFTIADTTYRTPALGISIVGADGKWYSMPYLDLSTAGVWKDSVIDSTTSPFALYTPTGSVKLPSGLDPVFGDNLMRKSLADWAADPTYGPLLFGSGAKVVQFGFNLGTYQRNAYAYIDWVETNVLDNGARNNFDASPNQLSLNPTQASIYIKPSETCVVDLNVSNLLVPVSGLQAMLNFSSTYFNAGTGVGQPIVAAGGGIWDTLIYDLWNTGGDLDVAVGVNLDLAGGTQADATTAKITLTPTGTEGVTTMIFRSDASEDPGLVASTYLSDVAGEPVWPTKVNSVNIYIDGTKPLIDITDDLGSNPVLQGTYTITVTASDENSGLVGAPVVKLDGNVLSASGSGPWTYTVVVNSSTTNGAHAITADISDNAGNAADQDVRNFTVNKNEINGTVTMPGYVGGTRAVAFSIDGATPVSQNLTFNSSGVASYKLVNVATPTTLSAKTAWTLRDKNTLSFDGDGQAVSNFTLLGGDINATNSVNVLDYSVLKLRWLSYNAAADVNGDGVVTVLDYDIMKANWFKTGDTQ